METGNVFNDNIKALLSLLNHRN